MYEAGGWGGGAIRIFQIPIFGQKACNIRAKPLDFQASNGENIRATDLSPPKRTWSHTPMGKCIIWNLKTLDNMDVDRNKKGKHFWFECLSPYHP